VTAGADTPRVDLRRAGLLTIAAWAWLALLSWDHLSGPSDAPHYAYQAQAWLDGQLHLVRAPPHLNDWARAGDRWYVSFPPLPAVLALPFVAAWGLAFNDVVFTLFFGGLNAGLAWLLLQRLARAGRSERTPRENLWLAALMAFGTVHAWCAIRGEVWYTAQTVGVTFLCAHLVFIVGARHPLLAGASLACAALCRPPMAFALPIAAYELWRAHRGNPGRTLRAAAAFAAPLVALAAIAMWHNAARFGDPLEFGHRYLFHNRVGPDIARFGLFDLHYLARNLRAAFTLLPHVRAQPPWLTHDGHGMSLLVTTPAFVLLLWPRLRGPFHAVLWAAAAAVALPSLVYMNTGWYQFGYRFSLDWTPIFVVLLAIGGRPLTLPARALIMAGVFVNVWGAVVFNR
jgi:hypothetical protein